MSGKAIVHVRNLLIPVAILVAPAALTTAAARAQPILLTNQSCYLVGQRVQITGIGFAALRMYQVAVDDINFGLGTTNAFGDFAASLIPGGLGANIVEHHHSLSANDGTSVAATIFTVTRSTGARIIAGTGTARTLRAPFQVWGFALVNGMPQPYAPTAAQLRVYVHYLSPHKHLRKTVALGRTTGQCGYLKTQRRRVFPFVPSRGSWTLQVDTAANYTRRPAGPVAKITVQVS